MAIRKIVSKNFPFIPIVFAPVYAGKIKMGKLAPFTVSVITLGNEVMIGRGVTDKFKIIFDHGRKVIIEL